MAQATRTPNSTFVRGLITETSPLNFPENASIDELNCDLERTGKRKVRKGIDFDSAGSLSSWTLDQGQPTAEFTWTNVSGQSGVEFLVIQTGATLRFYDKSETVVSDGEKSFTVDLNAYTASNDYIVENERVSGATIGSHFVVASRAIETIILTYDVDSDSVSATQMNPKVRDFDWQGDTTTYFDRVSAGAVTAARKYDTFNTGWVSRAGDIEASNTKVLDTFQSDTGGSWPELNNPWHAGKDPTADEKFKTKLWERAGRGNTLIANGHFILDLYNKQRANAYNNDPLNNEASISTTQIPDEAEANRFSTVVSYAGRAWLSGINSSSNGSKVFFTKVITSIEDFDKFYSVNDPTSEDLSDLLANDGGVIDLPQASRITALFEWGNSLLVFAENGVWEIKGIDGVFKATEYAVTRVRGTDGLVYTSTLVDVEGVPFWWGPTGIYTIQGDQITTNPTGVDLGKDTIQTFWEDIGAAFRSKAKGAYDKLNKRILWLYGDDATVDFKFNRILWYDTVLQAFFPWDISDEPSNTNYILGAHYFSGLGSTTTTYDVWTNNDTDDVLTNASVDDVVQDIATEVADASRLVFIIRDGSTGTVGFGEFDSTTYKDWSTIDYDAYAKAAYIFDTDLTTRKKNIYVTTFFDRTEDGFTGASPNFTPTNQSKCTLKAYWDDKTTASSSKEVYRLLKPVVADEGDLTAFNYPSTTVVTRNRIRGRGRYLVLEFRNTPGKQFSLIGYEVINAKNQGL